jgi:hypothetical protein
MPSRDETAFGALDVTATTTRTSQCPARRAARRPSRCRPDARRPAIRRSRRRSSARRDPEPRARERGERGRIEREPGCPARRQRERPRTPPPTRRARSRAARCSGRDVGTLAPPGRPRTTSRKRPTGRLPLRQRARRRSSMPVGLAPPNPTRASTASPSSVSEMLPVAGRFQLRIALPPILDEREVDVRTRRRSGCIHPPR